MSKKLHSAYFPYKSYKVSQSLHKNPLRAWSAENSLWNNAELVSVTSLTDHSNKKEIANNENQ